MILELQTNRELTVSDLVSYYGRTSTYWRKCFASGALRGSCSVDRAGRKWWTTTVEFVRAFHRVKYNIPPVVMPVVNQAELCIALGYKRKRTLGGRL